MTDRDFTGYLHNDYIKLVYMNARWYDPAIGRYISADAIVPYPANADGFWGFYGAKRGNWARQRITCGTRSEEFADMFLGWTNNQWETGSGGNLSAAGQMRANFMDVHMAEWVRDE